MKHIARPQDLYDYIDERKKESYRYDLDSEWAKSDVADIDSECASLISKYHEARKAKP